MVPFNVPCGDWIFPSRDSSTNVQYPIVRPLVADIFPMQAGQPVSDAWEIDRHLNGPRFVNVSLPSNERLLIESLCNRAEPMFMKEIGFEIQFEPRTLARSRELWPRGGYDGDLIRPDSIRVEDWNGIFFTSILLQAYLAGRPLPNGISFREATMPEIESLGRWRH